MKIRKNSFEKENKLIIYKSVKILVYCVLLIYIILINISSAIFPSASVDIKNNLRISNLYYGLFFLFSSIGKIIGILLFFQIKKLYNRKILLLLGSLTNTIIFFIFFYSDNFYIISSLKGVMGITDMLLQLFVPEWIQQFGFDKYELILITITQLANPFGKCLAFFIIYSFSHITLFRVEEIFLAVVFFSILLIPNKYTAKNILILNNNESKQKMVGEKWDKDFAIYTNEGDENEKSFPLIEKNIGKNDELNFNLNIKDIVQQNGNHKIIHIQQIPLLDKLKIIVKNKIFMISLVIRIILIGIETSIVLWIPDIIIKVIEIEKSSYYNLLGNILIIITPPLGNFFTSFMGQFTIVGNKRKRNTVVLLIFFYIFLVFISILIPSTKSFSFVGSIIFFLFCSSTCLPMLQGICISSINKKVKENILTFIHIFTLFFGNGIMPFIFGCFYDKIEYDKILMIKYFLYINLGIGFFLLPILIYFIYRKDFREIERNYSIRSSGISIDLGSSNGQKDFMEELGKAYGGELPKKKQKTKLEAINI